GFVSGRPTGAIIARGCVGHNLCAFGGAPAVAGGCGSEIRAAAANLPIAIARGFGALAAADLARLLGRGIGGAAGAGVGPFAPDVRRWGAVFSVIHGTSDMAPSGRRV